MARGGFSGHGGVAERPIRVEGLAELRRAFAAYDRNLDAGVREALDASGQPVRFDAQSTAASTPSGMARNTIPWDRMRVGITRVSVYVAPVQRGVKSKSRASLRRPKFKTAMLDRVLDPALDRNRDRTEREFADQLAELARAWERI